METIYSESSPSFLFNRPRECADGGGFAAPEITNRIAASRDFALHRHLTKIYLQRDNPLYCPGDKIDRIYFPLSAVFSEFEMLDDGRTSEIAIIGNEGMAGLEVVLNGGTAANWLSVSVPGSALSIRPGFFKKEFDNNRQFRSDVLRYLQLYREQTTRKIICSRFHLIEKRLAGWLLLIGDRSGRMKFDITQEELARVFGVHRPSITRVTQELRRRGLIGYRRGAIEIKNRAGLIAQACSCYGEFIR
ncbi:MAG: Crp/Fnr family transcriptional regulator [Pyrinomonadaceae bacterium]|nr:Crp/Fnr family transcriptional regulator [Pyrinomonadaceae bacterium]